jgi:hypothetical protein
MKMKFVLFAGLLLTAPLMAEEGHDHDHDHEGETSDFDVEAYQLTLKGTQPFGEACYIGVVAQGQDESGAYFADIETSFDHEGEGPGRLQVKFDASRPGLLSAVEDNGSRISISLKDNGSSLVDALRFAVRWVHEDHTDSGLCEGLTLIHDAAAEQAETPAY